MLIGGYYFSREAVEKLLRSRIVGIEFLMSAAAVAAFALGQAAEALTLVFLYSISEAFESYTEDKTRNSIRALMNLAPKIATVMRNGEEAEIDVGLIVPGDVFLVRPGQYMPTDGIVIRGDSSVNQAPVTGESVPVHKTDGNIVFAGTINESGALEVEATRTVDDNTLSRIIHLVEEAQEQKATSERFIHRFGKWYSPIVLLIGILLFIIPSLLDGQWHDWAVRATVFIVAASPCALVISIPITMVAALGTSARKGILIKGGIHLEALARIRIVALDKTGTLTTGKARVSDILPHHGQIENHVLMLAASVERFSQHPLAHAISEEVRQRDLTLYDATEFESHTSQGVSAKVDGSRILVGSPNWFAVGLAVDLSPWESRISSLQREGKTVVLVGSDTDVFGIIAIRDGIRPNALESINTLRQVGIRRTVMLTGDNAVTAAAIAEESGVDEYIADLKPEDKSSAISELMRKYGDVMMVGDGVNDAPALATATIGVAMGAAGTDVALETADVALMADDLSKLPLVLQHAKRARRVVRQNLALSMVVITGMVIGSIFGGFSLPVTVIGHELSELLVMLNGLRLLRI
jgi:Cd2+/Zn2+-exporting ATPase